MAINKKLIHFNTFENFNSKKLSANIENTKYTLGINGEIQNGSPDILYQSIVYIKDTKQQWTHGQLYSSNANIKTINGQSLLGNGDLEIQEFKTYTFDFDDNQDITITQEELNKILESDKIYIKNNDILVEVTVKEESDSSLFLIGYNNRGNYVNEYNIVIDKNDLTSHQYYDNITLVTDSDLEDSTTEIHYKVVECPYMEDGLVLEEQYIFSDLIKISVLPVYIEELSKIFYLYSNTAIGDYLSTIVFYGKYTDDSLLKATYNPENQTLTFNIIEQNVSTQKTTQTIQLNQGWNWVSFYVETSLEKLQNALGTNGIEIKYMDFTTSYDEESGLWLSAGNPLTSIEPSKMYMINTNSDCVIELEGKLLEDVEITLNQGENNISYPLEYESDINIALQNINASLGDMIKDNGTSLIATHFNGKWVGSLTTLKPGQGYIYTSNSAETITFKYPDSIDVKLSNYTTKEYVDEEINQVNTKIDSYHNKIAIQTIELTEGMNSVSFYVDITLEQLQEALGNNALQIKDEIARKYIQYSQTSGWYGTLKELVAGRYYGINIASSCKILLIGTLLNSNEITYRIGSGYSYIGYPLNHKLNINTAFKSIEPQEGDYLSTCVNGEKETISQYSEGVWNGVQQLIPGQGYTYYSNADTNKHFTYPSVEIDFLSFVTEDDLKSKLQEAKDYTDTKTDELRDVVTQTLSLRAGYKWCSFYVDITLEQLQRAFGTNGVSITTSYDGGETEVTSSYDANTNTWSGDLTTLDVTKMYIINVNTDCEISLTGRKIPNSTSYTLNPGWNWISYPFNEPMDISDALANVEAVDGDAIKNKSGDLYIEYYQEYGWLVASTTSEFIPGQGYEYYNASTEPNTLVFTTELIDTKSELNKKQDTITDLEVIRQGAAKGATALQEHQDISSKADVDGNPNGIVVRDNSSYLDTPVKIYPGGIESLSYTRNDALSTDWHPDFMLAGNILALGSGVSGEDGFKIEAIQNIRTQDDSDIEFLRTSHTMIQQYDERGNYKGTGLLLTDDFIQLYTYNSKSEISGSENMIELEESGVYFNDMIIDTRLRGIAEPISNHDAVNKKYVDDNYVSINNVKTINGKSIIGEGDITIESSSSNNTKTPIIRITVNNGNCEVSADTKTYITCDGNVNISLKSHEEDNYVHSYEIVLLIGEIAYSISFPNSVKWSKPLTITKNTRYNIIIEDNIATWVSIQN